MTRTRQILFASRPRGMPTPDNFRFVETVLPPLRDGQILIKSLFLSVDPYMRGRMNEGKSYIEPFVLNEPIPAGGVGEVVESKHERFAPGDLVVGLIHWADYTLSNGEGLSKLPAIMAPIASAALGVAGMPGLTAYFGLLDIGRPRAGETVVVSGAAGAVGSVVGQIAKMQGCRVIGIAGGKDKCSYLQNELSFDATINYKDGDIRTSLDAACPNGVDVYFDNVGGDITDAVVERINFGARIVICGQISAYNLDRQDVGPRLFTYLLKNSALAKGFIVNDYRERFGEAITALSGWVMEGKLKYREHVVQGLENTVDAFLGLFRGDNIGKIVVKV
jgi:NADPH-dependent curcumin reductase CurA